MHAFIKHTHRLSFQNYLIKNSSLSMFFRKFSISEKVPLKEKLEVNIMGYGAAGVRHFIQNCRQDDRHLGFYKKFRFIGKTWKL